MTTSDRKTGELDPTDPVFISYRHKDGASIAANLAWAMRAAGIPVWRDKDDLPPGDTQARLEEAIAEGISGGILIVTRDVRNSTIVRFVESPALITLHQSDPGFALGVLNAVVGRNGRTDYKAPDRLLAKEPGTLEGVDQQPADLAGQLKLIAGLLTFRARRCVELVEATDSFFEVTVQTRNAPGVYDRSGSPLDIRLRPPTHARLPSGPGLEDLQRTLPLLPAAVTAARASGVRIKGGAHLSAAFAVGATLPSSRVGRFEAVDHRGDVWAATTESRMPEPELLQVAASSAQPSSSPSTLPRVAVFLQLLATQSPSAVARFLEEHGNDFTAWLHLVPKTPGLLEPGSAGDLAAEAMHRIRELSRAHDNAEVHLLLACPFGLAVLLGHLSNTLRTVVYEWNDSVPSRGKDARPTYLPALTVQPSNPNGAITHVWPLPLQ